MVATSTVAIMICSTSTVSHQISRKALDSNAAMVSHFTVAIPLQQYVLLRQDHIFTVSTTYFLIARSIATVNPGTGVDPMQNKLKCLQPAW